MVEGCRQQRLFAPAQPCEAFHAALKRTTKDGPGDVASFVCQSLLASARQAAHFSTRSAVQLRTRPARRVAKRRRRSSASDGLTKARRKLQACVCFQSLSFVEQLGCLILVFHMRSVIFAEFMLDLELGCTGAGQFSLLRVVRTSFAHSCGVEKQHRYS